MLKAADYVSDPAADDYKRLGLLLRESYDNFKRKNENRPFIILCLGNPYSGKSTLLGQLKIILEESEKKVIEVPDRPHGQTYSGWNDYTTMINTYSDADILLYETTTSLPSEGAENVGFSISMSINMSTAMERFDKTRSHGAYSSSRGHDRTAKPHSSNWPDINIDTTDSELTSQDIRKLITMGMTEAGKRDQIRQDALSFLEEAYIFQHGENMPRDVRDIYWKLILAKDRYPVEGKRVLYIGNSFSYYPLIDAVLGAKEVVVTDVNPGLITVYKFLENRHSEITNRIRIVNNPVNIENLDKAEGIYGEFDQVNAWNVLSGPGVHVDARKAVLNCINKIANGGGLWITSLANMRGRLVDIKNVVLSATESYGRKAFLGTALNLPSETYDAYALSYYFQITENPIYQGRSSRAISESL